MKISAGKMATGAAIFAAALLAGIPASSHLADRTAAGGVVARDHWASFPVRWALNPSIGSNIQGSRTVANVIQSSFNTWLAAPNASISLLRVADSAKTSAG